MPLYENDSMENDDNYFYQPITKKMKMSSNPESSKTSTENGIENVMRLTARKENIEREISELHEILKQEKNVGMKGPLVDSEDYPRSDIDVAKVRNARHKIICLQNDHKALLKEIEAGLHAVHSQNPQPHGQNTSLKLQKEKDVSPPFARVDKVDLNSPAFIAGLQVNDAVVKFGSVTLHNFQGQQSLSAVVKHSINRPISVDVLREGNIVNLSLTPKVWEGNGVLGCIILPIDQRNEK